jgi:hypothetical protein
VSDAVEIELPDADPDRDPAGNQQVAVLLAAATSLMSEDLQRQERHDAGLRAELAATATFFAVVQAAVIALLNGVLARRVGTEASDFVPWLAGIGSLATAATAVAAVAAFRATRDVGRMTRSLSSETIRDYIEFARQGRSGVAVNVLWAYTHVIDDRRSQESTRAPFRRLAHQAMILALVVLVTELILAFVAVSLR